MDNEYSDLDSRVIDVFYNRDEYSYEAIKNAEKQFRIKGYVKEAKELKNYINSFFELEPNEEAEEPSKMTAEEVSLKGYYRGSVTTVWIDFYKYMCYGIVVLNTALGVFIGMASGRGSDTKEAILYSIVLGLIFFILGFIIVSAIMVFLTMCENISIIADNTAQILERMDEE